METEIQEVKVEIEIGCANCGAGFTKNSKGYNRKNIYTVCSPRVAQLVFPNIQPGNTFICSSCVSYLRRNTTKGRGYKRTLPLLAPSKRPQKPIGRPVGTGANAQAWRYLRSSNYEGCIRSLIKNEKAKTALEKICTGLIRKERNELLTNRNGPFRSTLEPEGLEKFPWEESLDWGEEKAPTMMACLKAMFPEPDKLQNQQTVVVDGTKRGINEEEAKTILDRRTGMVLSQILYTANTRKLCFVQACIGVEMWRQGSSQKLFRLLNSLGICQSVPSALGHVERLSKGHDTPLKKRRAKVECVPTRVRLQSTDDVQTGNSSVTWDNVQMGEVSADAVTLDLLREARQTVRSSPLGVINTPMIPWCQTTLPLSISCNIHIKLENMQRTGSFKIRGVANQFARREKGGPFVTMSAGNYGKSFAYASKHYGSKGKVVMPETAPASRSILIQSFGVEVERVPTSCLMDVVNRCVQEDNMTFLHSYDDLDLIAGHASLGMEVLEVMPEPDVLVVCCGGGGLLAGVAAAVKLSGCDKTRVYGVEPEGACTMYRSFIEKKPVGMDTKSIASGLAPPFAGTLPYELCQRYVEEIVLVSDEEIKTAVSVLYRSGLVVEPSGSAAFAAIVNNKIPDLEGKNVVCVLSGGNIGKDELANFPD